LPAKKQARMYSGKDRDDVGGSDNGHSSSALRPKGEALISFRVSVLWDDDGTWYNGIITDFRVFKNVGKHQIVYDVPESGQIMRTVGQAQGLLGQGITTHEWLIFEEPKDTVKRKKGGAGGSVVRWKLIEEEEAVDSGFKPVAPVKKNGPGTYARSVGRSSKKVKVENDSVAMGSSKLTMGRVVSTVSRKSNVDRKAPADFDESFIEQEFSHLNEITNESDFVTMIDDIDDPGGTIGRNRDSLGDTGPGEGQWNLFMPFDIDGAEDDDEDLPHNGFEENFSHIFDSNDYHENGEESDDATHSDDNSDRDSSNYSDGGSDFESMAAKTSLQPKSDKDNRRKWKSKSSGISTPEKSRTSSVSGGGSGSSRADTGKDTMTNSMTGTANIKGGVTKQPKEKEPEYHTLSGETLTKSWLRENGFDKPILVTSQVDKLEMEVPGEDVRVHELCASLGNDEVVSGLRVKAESEINVKLSEWAQHFSIKDRPKDDPAELRIPTMVVNKSRLGKTIRVPKFVQELDWVNMVLSVGDEEVFKQCRILLNLGKSIGLNKNWDSRRHVIGEELPTESNPTEPVVVMASGNATPSCSNADNEAIKKVESTLQSGIGDVTEASLVSAPGSIEGVIIAAVPSVPEAMQTDVVKAVEVIGAGVEKTGDSRKAPPVVSATPALKTHKGNEDDEADDVDEATRTAIRLKRNLCKYQGPSLLCSMRTEGTYSDFHIDEGGASTWYYIQQGETWVYFIPPTIENLEKYENWYTEDNVKEVFFGDLVSDCFKLKIVAGNVLAIPSGWIHAMYARANSVLIGSSFSTTLCLSTQVRVHHIERSCGREHSGLRDVFWHVAKHYWRAMLDCSLKKRQYRRRRGQIEREGTKLSKTRENRQKARVENQAKLKRARSLAEQKIKALKALGGSPTVRPPLPPLSVTMASMIASGALTKTGKPKGKNTKKATAAAKKRIEEATSSAAANSVGEPEKKVPLTPLQAAQKECDDAIAARDQLERDIEEAEELHRIAVAREKDLRARQKVEMAEMTEGQLSISELRELVRLVKYLRHLLGVQYKWKAIEPPEDEAVSVDSESMTAQNASKLKSDIRRANEARQAGLAKGTDGMEGVSVSDAGDTSFIKYHHRPMPIVIRKDSENMEIPKIIKNPLHLLDDLDRLFWFQRAHACAKKGVPAYVEDFAELDDDNQASKLYEPKNPKYEFLWDANGRPPGIGKRGVDMKGLCKCHLKKCLVCRNCEKRHCWCPGGPLDPHAPPVPKKKPKPKKKPPPVQKPVVQLKAARKGPAVTKVPKPKLTHEQEQALVRMKWRRRLALDTVKGTAAAAEAEDMAKWRTKASKDSEPEAIKPKTKKEEPSGADHIVPPDASGNRIISHRASCHRCGNLRKKTMNCDRCPHVFCQKCGEKMQEEHGEMTFRNGCPVCKELCCCGVNRSVDCGRLFHCYKKCPAMKKLGRRGKNDTVGAGAMVATPTESIPVPTVGSTGAASHGNETDSAVTTSVGSDPSSGSTKAPVSDAETVGVSIASNS
jgi:hypothetical protein